MSQLTYYTPRSPLARALAPLAAVGASYLPPPALRPLVKPCVRCSNESRRPRARRLASRTIDLLVGDGMSLRVKRQHGEGS